jgi:hypothetical protein
MASRKHQGNCLLGCYGFIVWESAGVGEKWEVGVVSEKVFNHTAHVALWDWLAKNPGQVKWNWPGWSEIEGDPSQYEYCFGCEAIKPGRACENGCPLVWSKHMSVDGCGKEWFFWEGAKDDYEERTRLAEQIRDLPVREGVRCI